jgi:hypothetical protein
VGDRQCFQRNQKVGQHLNCGDQFRHRDLGPCGHLHGAFQQTGRAVSLGAGEGKIE